MDFAKSSDSNGTPSPVPSAITCGSRACNRSNANARSASACDSSAWALSMFAKTDSRGSALCANNIPSGHIAASGIFSTSSEYSRARFRSDLRRGSATCISASPRGLRSSVTRSLANANVNASSRSPAITIVRLGAAANRSSAMAKHAASPKAPAVKSPRKTICAQRPLAVASSIKANAVSSANTSPRTSPIIQNASSSEISFSRRTRRPMGRNSAPIAPGPEPTNRLAARTASSARSSVRSVSPQAATR